MGLKEYLIKKRLSKNKDSSSNDSALGKVYIKPSEESKFKDSKVSYEVRTGSPTTTSRTSSRSSGGGKTPTTAPITSIKEAVKTITTPELNRQVTSQAQLRGIESVESSSKKSIQEAALERQRRGLEEYRAMEAERQERFKKEEGEKIESARLNILDEGGRTSTTTLTDKATGDKIEVKTIEIDKIVNGRKIKEKIIERTNKTTGEVETKTYKYNPRTRRVELTGGLKTTPSDSNITAMWTAPTEEILTRREMAARYVEQFNILEKPFSGSAKLITSSIGKVVGKGTEKGLELLGVEKIPAKYVLFPISPVAGAIPSKIKLTPEQAGKVSEKIIGTSLDVGKYAVPIVGQTLFFGEVGELGREVYKTKKAGEKITRGQKIELGLTAAAIVTGGVAKGAKAVKMSRIKLAEEELSKLGKQPIRYLQTIERGRGRITLTGFQTSETLERQIRVTGRIAKTEKGFEFIPEAKGQATTIGKIGKRQLAEIQLFETGAKGKSIPIEQLGELTLTQNIGVSTFIPKSQTFALFKPTRRGIKLAEKQFESNIQLGGDIIKDIQTSQTLFKGRKLGLTVSEESLGLTVVKESKQTKMLGRKYFTETKTPLGETFAKQEVKQIAPPKFDVKRVKTGLESPTLKKPEVKIEYARPSLYAGTGLYERTEVYTVPAKKLEVGMQPSLMQIKQIEAKREIKFLEPKVQQRFKTQIKQESKQVELLKTDIKAKEKFEIAPKLKEAQILETKQRQKQKLQTKQFLETISLQKAIQKPVLKEEVKLTETIKIPKPKESFPQRLAKKIDEDGFEIFKKVGGIFKSEGTVFDLGAASQKLKKSLLKDLSASGFVVEKRTGKKVSAQELAPFGKFRVSKQKGKEFLLVQKKTGRGGRLSSFSERKEIQLFKARSQKKKNLFFG